MVLYEQEINELMKRYLSYTIEPKTKVDPNWVTRMFQTTGRKIDCVENRDGSVTIHRINHMEIRPLEDM